MNPLESKLGKEITLAGEHDAAVYEECPGFENEGTGDSGLGLLELAAGGGGGYSVYAAREVGES